MGPLAIVGIIAASAAVSAGAGVGIAMASKPDYPEQPDYGKTNKTVREAEFDTLPGQRAVEMAARMGTKVKYPTGRKEIVYGPDWIEHNGTMVHPPIGVQDQYQTADFTGMGDVDRQAQYARETAQDTLENQQKYGVDFVKEAKRQLELSDPTGTQARGQLFDQVMADLNGPAPQRPVASELNSQLAGELASDKLPQDVNNEVRRSVLDSAMADRGAVDEIGARLETESAAGNRIADQQRMLQWLTSGATPQDVEYRRKQQALSNVSSFLAGRTPQAQFNQLSGSQQGASPNYSAPGLPNFGNAGQGQAMAGAGQEYATRVQAAADQVNPWLVGLSSAMQLAGTGMAAYGAMKGNNSGTAKSGSSASANQFSYQTGN